MTIEFIEVPDKMTQRAFDRLSKRINDGTVQNDMAILLMYLVTKMSKLSEGKTIE